MTTRDQRDIERALENKGFERDETHHRCFIYRTLDGKNHKSARTSHGSNHKTLGEPLLSQMAKQVSLTKNKFLEFVDCTLDQAGYEKEPGVERVL
ncbi:Addiction module toxin, HicA family [Azospirillaceae bacterium]